MPWKKYLISLKEKLLLLTLWHKVSLSSQGWSLTKRLTWSNWAARHHVPQPPAKPEILFSWVEGSLLFIGLCCCSHSTCWQCRVLFFTWLCAWHRVGAQQLSISILLSYIENMYGHVSVSPLDIFEMWVLFWVQAISLPQPAEQLGLQAYTSKTLEYVCPRASTHTYTLTLTLMHMSMSDLSF